MLRPDAALMPHSFTFEEAGKKQTKKSLARSRTRSASNPTTSESKPTKGAAAVTEKKRTPIPQEPTAPTTPVQVPPSTEAPPIIAKPPQQKETTTKKPKVKKKAKKAKNAKKDKVDPVNKPIGASTQVK